VVALRRLNVPKRMTSPETAASAADTATSSGACRVIGRITLSMEEQPPRRLACAG
jgi:hypothetical protein